MGGASKQCAGVPVNRLGPCEVLRHGRWAGQDGRDDGPEPLRPFGPPLSAQTGATVRQSTTRPEFMHRRGLGTLLPLVVDLGDLFEKRNAQNVLKVAVRVCVCVVEFVRFSVCIINCVCVCALAW